MKKTIDQAMINNFLAYYFSYTYCSHFSFSLRQSSLFHGYYYSHGVNFFMHFIRGKSYDIFFEEITEEFSSLTVPSNNIYHPQYYGIFANLL